MRLRTLIAPSMGQAMDLLRRELGEDAIIVSSETTAHGVKLIAAVDEPDEEFQPIDAVTADPFNGEPAADPIDVVHEVLVGHGVPNRLLERLIDMSFLVGADDPFDALSGAVEGVFSFKPLDLEQRLNRPLMLVGPPGAGKTVATAKIAARAVFSGRAVRLITTDTIRAGGIEQLDAFARLMRLRLHTAETDRQLMRLIDAAAPDEMVLIDSPGINPFSNRDFLELQSLVKAAAAEPILVMAGGGDVVDAMEQAQEFQRLGPERLLVTRLDMVRRLGSILAAADEAQLALTDCSNTPSVAEGLAPLNPTSLAQMLMPRVNSERSAFYPVSQGARP